MPRLVRPSVCLSVPPRPAPKPGLQSCADCGSDPSAHGRRSAEIGGAGHIVSPRRITCRIVCDEVVGVTFLVSCSFRFQLVCR